MQMGHPLFAPWISSEPSRFHDILERISVFVCGRSNHIKETWRLAFVKRFGRAHFLNLSLQLMPPLVAESGCLFSSLCSPFLEGDCWKVVLLDD
jgi:hypothetical protein